MKMLSIIALAITCNQTYATLSDRLAAAQNEIETIKQNTQKDYSVQAACRGSNCRSRCKPSCSSD